MLDIEQSIFSDCRVKEPSFSLPLTRKGDASSRRRGLIEPPRHFVAVPLGNGDKIGFALSGESLSGGLLTPEQVKNTCASINSSRLVEPC